LLVVGAIAVLSGRAIHQYFIALGGAALIVVGSYCLRTAKQVALAVRNRAQYSLPVPFVLYLRSFKSDPEMSCSNASGFFNLLVGTPFGHMSEEEQWAKLFGLIAPVVAIGEPGEIASATRGSPTLCGRRMEERCQRPDQACAHGSALNRHWRRSPSGIAACAQCYRS
jgi:hypothetical protein